MKVKVISEEEKMKTFFAIIFLITIGLIFGGIIGYDAGSDKISDVYFIDGRNLDDYLSELNKRAKSFCVEKGYESGRLSYTDGLNVYCWNGESLKIFDYRGALK